MQNMKQVTFDRRRFLQTYRHVAFTLQLLSCVATTATYVRVTDQFRLPVVFLALPALLFILLSVDRCFQLRDRYLASVMTGAITGFVSGFLATVVRNDVADAALRRELLLVSDTKKLVVTTFCTLEFLHLPVVFGAIAYTLCLLFSRLPPLAVLILSMATATCGAAIFTIGLAVVYNDRPPQDGFGVVAASTVLLVFVIIFILALMPAMRANKRAWLVAVGGFIVAVYWQTGFLDTMQWDWERSYFPIPGALTGLLVLFTLDLVDLSESADFAGAARRPAFDSDIVPAESESEAALHTALTWHVGAYVVERTSLTFILESRSSAAKAGHRPPQTDIWLCCLGMLGLLSLLTTRRLTLFVRMLIVVLGVTLYVCVSVANGHISNGYFIDGVFGLAILSTAVTSDFVNL